MKKFPYVNRYTSAGQEYFYFRQPGRPSMRLPGKPGSPEFVAAYKAALAAPLPKPPDQTERLARANIHSVAYVVRQFFDSDEFRLLAKNTQVHYQDTLNRFSDVVGTKTFGTITRDFIEPLIRRRKPHAARNWLKAIRALMRYGVTYRLCPADVTEGIKISVPRSDGHRPWDEDEIEQFEDHYPVGTQPRLAFALGLNTGQRRGDVIRMGRAHIKKGVMTIKQGKTGVTVRIPVSAELARMIMATPTGEQTFLLNQKGRPWEDNDFSESFRKLVDAAGLPGDLTFHGLRKTVARRLVHGGCNVHQIASVTGHKTLGEIERYTRDFNREELAREAMAKLTKHYGK